MVNPTYLSNLSYTNKDFQSIYVELLDLVKKLTYRWDPSTSNESDPGVLLIKLMAICTDKTNYTSDKNVLECFPESVTQEQNARQLFEQLGYMMRWYRSASTTISMRWKGDESIYSYTVPRFTMVSNDKNSIVYTLTEERSLTGDGATVNVTAVQGVAENYSVNGEELITAANLDANNRLYFPYRNIAENGIFICNADSTSACGKQENYESWVRKPNLAVEPLGNTYYKFGVSHNGESCYIEFPDDAQTLIGEGIYVTYILSDGDSGNIGAKMIEKFYSDVTIVDPADSESTVVLDSSNVAINNLSSAKNGYNPESIDEAYRNYKKTVGTFNTLVTLRDYANAILESGMVSNCFVCDRANDPQVSYAVLSKDNDALHYVNYVETSADDEPFMDAFDLKMCLLQRVDNPSTAEEFNGSFDVVVNSGDPARPVAEPVVDNILSYINDAKSIQHDFQPILPFKPIMFRNKYTVNCKIIPQYRVTSLQEDDIRKRVQEALYSKLNATQLEFGEEVTYAQVYDIITNADERIKAITLDTLSFTTYAVIYDGITRSFIDVPLSDLDIRGVGEYDASTDSMSGVTPVSGDIYYATNTHKTYRYDADSTPKYIPSAESDVGLDIFAKSILHGNTPLTQHADKFTLAYDQSVMGTVEDVSKISTDVSITVHADSAAAGLAQSEITLGENEVLQFYAPSLIDKTNYSNYVKYQFQLNQNVDLPSNSDYALQPGESLVLYWKDSDADSDYTYQKYESPTIVRTTFPLRGPVNTTNYTGEFLAPGRGTTVGAQFDYTEGGVTQRIPVTSFVESNMNGSAYVLTSSKTITIREKNRITLDNTKYKCYWHLNSKNSDGKFELFSAKSDNFDEAQSYLLQNGEYFFYTNFDESMLAYWGEGTRIERKCTSASPAMVCDVVDISNFQKDGISSFENYWVTLSTTYKIIGEETQFIALGEGTKVTFQGKTPTGFDFSIGYDGIDWGGSPGDLNDYTIRYQIPDSADTVTLPKIMISGSSWDCRAILGFVAGQTEPQKLVDGQSITYYTADSNSDVITGNSDNPVYVLADYSYALGGGHDIDITRMNSRGDITYAKLYWYHSSASTDTNIDYKSDGNTKLTFSPTASALTLSFKFHYDYNEEMFFLPLYNPYSDVTSLTVTCNGSSVADVFGNADFSAKGTHYMVLHGIDFQQDASLTVTLSYTGDGTRTLTMRSPYRVVRPDTISEAEFLALYDKVISLDPRGVFDYTYQVDEDDIIENPLDPISFLNPKHIYNKFTMCQLDTSALSVYITNKIK